MTIKGCPWWASGPNAQVAPVQSLVRELRSCMSRGTAKKKKKCDFNSLIGRGWDIILGGGIRERLFSLFFDFWYFFFIFLCF